MTDLQEQDFSTLLDDVKNYLDITWTDEAEDKKLAGIIKRGIAYLDDKAGAELGYLTEGTPKALLLDYVRYVRAAALDEFEVNYQHELLTLNLKYRVKEWADAEKEATGHQL